MSENSSSLYVLNEKRPANVWNDISYAILLSKADFKLYDRYKNGDAISLNEYQTTEMKILSILERLGYPMDELGTYLYKEVVMSAYNEMMENNNTDNLKKEVNSRYSNFYHMIARDYYEMGVKSFHSYIEKACSKKIEEKKDYMLIDRIFSQDELESNYGNKALIIASYMYSQYKMFSSDKYKKKLAVQM